MADHDNNAQGRDQVADRLLTLIDFNDFARLLKDAPDDTRLDVYLQIARLVTARRGTTAASEAKGEINKMIDKMFEPGN